MNLVLVKLPADKAVLYSKRDDTLFRVYPLVEPYADVNEIMSLITHIQRETFLCLQTQNASA